MGMFNFFSEREHRVFDYKPVYYNKDEEERKRLFSQIDGQKEDKEQAYVPGSYIKGAFRDGNYQGLRRGNRIIHTIIGVISLLLVFGILYFFAKFYSLL